MAIDTPGRRFSMMQFANVTTTVLWNNASGFSSGDQYQLLHLYRGISLDAPPDVVAVPVRVNIGTHGILAGRGKSIGRGL